MAGRTKAWAQCLSNTSGSTIDVICNGSTNTALDPTAISSVTALSATDQPFEVSAGVSISIKWGGQVSTVLAVAANTQVWTLNVYDDTSQSLWETTATDTLTLVGSATRTCSRTLTFTPTHSGTVRIFVRYRCTATVGGATVCDYNTDGGLYSSPAVVPTAGATNVGFTPGLVRAGTTLTSFAQSGGNGSGVYATYLNTIVNTLTTGHAPRSSATAQKYTISWKQVSTQFTTTTVPNGTTLTPADPGALVNNVVWPVASFSPNLVLTPDNSNLSTNPSGAGLPWVHYTSVPSSPGTVTTTLDGAGNIIGVTFTGAFTSDPRITFTQLLQQNDSSWGTPPISKNVASGQRLSSDLGFIAARATDANSAGVVTLAWTEKLWDNGLLIGSEAVPVKSRSSVAQTQGGQTGWSDAFITWDNTLPGGGWTQKEVITTSTATGLELSNTRALTLLSADPRVNLLARAEDPDNFKRHWSPGQKLEIVCALILNGVKTAFDAGTAKFSMVRYNSASGTSEYLTNPGLIWVTGDTPDLFTMAASAGDAKIAVYTFTAAQTVGFNYVNCVILVQMQLNSTPYFGRYVHEVVDNKNPHDSHEFNPTGLFM